MEQLNQKKHSGGGEFWLSSREMTNVGCQRSGEVVLKGICKGTNMAMISQCYRWWPGWLQCSAGWSYGDGTRERACLLFSALALLLAWNSSFKPSVCFDYVRSSCRRGTDRNMSLVEVIWKIQSKEWQNHHCKNMFPLYKRYSVCIFGFMLHCVLMWCGWDKVAEGT